VEEGYEKTVFSGERIYKQDWPMQFMAICCVSGKVKGNCTLQWRKVLKKKSIIPKAYKINI
jgi:hypothetical protein